MTQSIDAADRQHETLPKGIVVIAGGGPVGLLLAHVLSFYGVRSLLFERNDTTTKWPKMDLTNARSMELFHKLGLADDLRKQGVAPEIAQNVLISSGLSADKPLTEWKLPGVDEFRRRIQENNDGTQPQVPWQRISQAIFENWLKSLCDKNPLISLRYGHKVESVEEGDDVVKTTVTNVKTGTTTVWSSDFVAGCDGASSRVRRSLSLPLDGGPIPSCALLVHFKSKDLSRLHKQGRFWHIFFLGESGGFEAAIISQDEKDTWTTHLFMPLDAKPEEIDSHAAVYRVLGGVFGPYEVKIDEILVRSVWRPNIAVARTWGSPKGRVHIVGDAAHQNIPTGGYGMNMGIGDAFDLGWKLASVINGQGGQALLKSYELERRPVALRNVDHSGVHFQVHDGLKALLGGGDPRLINEDTEEGRALRSRVHEYYQARDGENKDFGIEMGYRYESPVIIRKDDDGKEPLFTPHHYTPTTWPGGRPPHLFLSDGTAIFDKFGKDWTLVVFTAENKGQAYLVEAAKRFSTPLVQLDLPQEQKAKELYERSLVLVRPDQHVAWRSNEIPSLEAALQVFRTVAGWIDTSPEQAIVADAKPKTAFTASLGMTTQMGDFSLHKMSEFQQ
ncbi:FAD binding domain containing protein [Fusarium agapanthi]|uniref:FAD binding domain containing protein n=1 Tax=Fusarium agapanthi TaxID=1803897 RepID=A0A9P5B817_9HYPO|nr:FAD binding domain containing protein [Fusarium agapanthi]